MNINLIFEGRATLEDLEMLNGLGYEFVVEDGNVSKIYKRGELIAD